MMPFPVSLLVPAQVGDAAPKASEASADTEGFGAALLAALAHPMAPPPALEIPADDSPELAASRLAAVDDPADTEHALVAELLTAPEDSGPTPPPTTLASSLAKVVAALFAEPEVRGAQPHAPPAPKPLAAPVDGAPLAAHSPRAVLVKASEPPNAGPVPPGAPMVTSAARQPLAEPIPAELLAQSGESPPPTVHKTAEEIRGMLAHEVARVEGANGLRIEIESIETSSQQAGDGTSERRLSQPVPARDASLEPTAPALARSKSTTSTEPPPAPRAAGGEAVAEPGLEARPELAPMRAAQVAAAAQDVKKAPAPVAPRVPYAAPPPSADQVTLRFAAEDGLEGRLRVAVRGGAVQATVLAPDAESLRRMEGEMTGLRRSLVEQGFTEARVTIRPMPGVVSADGRSETNEDPRGRGDHAESRNPERRDPEHHSGQRSSRGNSRHHPGREGERS